MSYPHVGEIRMFAGNFAPEGHLFCEGGTLQISEYETLFNLIGTTYGGDGESTFCLPDLRGKAPMHRSSSRPIGSEAGAAGVVVEDDVEYSGPTEPGYVGINFIIATSGIFPSQG